MLSRMRIHYSGLGPQIRRAVWASISVSLAMMLFGTFTFAEFLTAVTIQELVANGLPIFMAFMALISATLLWLNRASRGGWVLIISLWSSMLIAPMLAEGYGFIAALFSFAVTAYLGSQVLGSRQASIANFMSGAISIVIVLLDFYWPGERIPQDSTDIRVAQIITIVMAILYILFIIRQYRSYSLRTKLVLAFLAAVLLSTIVIASFTLSRANQFQRETLGTSLNTLAENQAAFVGDLLNNQVDTLVALALRQEMYEAIKENVESYGYQEAEAISAEILRLDQEWVEAGATNPLVQSRVNTPRIAQDLREFVQEFPDHAEVFLTDHLGGLVAATERTSDFYQADETWWQVAYRDGGGDIYIGSPEFDESTGVYAVNIAVPVRDPLTLNAIGVLRTTYRLSALEDILFGVDIGKTGEVDLVFLGEPAQAIHEGKLKEIDSTTLKALVDSAGQMYSEFEYDGAISLVSQAPLRSTRDSAWIAKLGWVVVLHQTVEEALAEIDTQGKTTLLLVLITITLVSIGALILAQYLAGPIVRLTVVAERVGAGDLSARAAVETDDEIGTLARTFNTMTGRLEDTVVNLEQRVVDRTRAIELSADVSRRLSTILDQSQLVSEVVNLLQFAFDYYHVHIYLFDDSSENLIMVGGTGEAGRILLEQGHRLTRGRGLVWRACDTGTVILVPDTHEDPNWLPNPQLPDTKAEVAVPIMLGEEVLGALDVQNDEVGGLNEQDADLLRSIANQVAIGLRNAQQYKDAQYRANQEIKTSAMIQQIQSTQTMNDALQIAVRELAHALDIKRVGIKVGNFEDGNVSS